MSLTVGVDLGGTKIQAVALSAGSVVGSHRALTPPTSADDVISALAAAAQATLPSLAGVTAIGVGTPGSVNTTTGHVSRSSNVAGFMDDVALGPSLSERLGGIPVVVDNDVRVATMGEFIQGAGRPYKNLLGVFVGTGVGGGLIIDGELRSGRGSAGEIGHTVVRPGGRRCPCGRRGCLEAYAGRLSLERTARRQADKGHHTKLLAIMEHKGRDRMTSSVFADAYDAGDRVAVHLIRDAVGALGLAIANAQNLLDLEAIIIGGGLGDRLGPPFVARVEAAMRKDLRQPDKPPVVLSTELGDLSGAVGAALAAASL